MSTTTKRRPGRPRGTGDRCRAGSRKISIWMPRADAELLGVAAEYTRRTKANFAAAALMDRATVVLRKQEPDLAYQPRAQERQHPSGEDVACWLGHSEHDQVTAAARRMGMSLSHFAAVVVAESARRVVADRWEDQ